MAKVQVVEVTLSDKSRAYGVLLTQDSNQVTIECLSEDAALRLRDVLSDESQYVDVAVSYAYVENHA